MGPLKKTAAVQLNFDDEQRRRDLQSRFQALNARPTQWQTKPSRINPNYKSDEATWQKAMQAYVAENWNNWAVPAHK